MLTGLHTLICEVSDMDRALGFYRDLLGLRVEMTSPYWSSLWLGETRIGLHPPMGGPLGATQSGWIFGVQVEDIKALRDLLSDAGQATGEYHDTPEGVVMGFTDPDGNRLQAIQTGVTAASL